MSGDLDAPELCPITAHLVRNCPCPMCSPGRPVEQEPGDER